LHDDTSLTIKQDKKQYDIFNNTVSTIILTDHIKITTINEALKKDSTTYTAELQITMNFIDYKMITINMKLQKTFTINIAESQIAVALINHSTKLCLMNVQRKHLLTTSQSHKQQQFQLIT
jgi:hypothetical protein